MEILPQGITKAGLNKAGIPEDYWPCDFNNYQGPDKAKKATIKYLRELPVMKDAGLGILYAGDYGRGKTTLAMIAMKYLARANWQVYCTSLGEIVEDIQRGFRDRVGSTNEPASGSVQASARAATFLFIDDVGKEHRGQSGFVTTVFDNLIRHRVQHRLPTFITTNYTKSELSGTYGESVISLLEGKLLVVTVDGRDFRRTELKQNLKEAFK